MHLPSNALVASVLLTLSSLGYTQTTDEFTLNCAPLTLQRTDPIVDPGEMSGHVHTVVGGTAFQPTMGPDTAKNSKATTCNKEIDKSSYWVPQMYHQTPDGKFELVKFDGNAVYYFNRACNYTEDATSCDLENNKIVGLAPPAGLRMVAGDPTLRTFNETSVEQLAISFHCLQEDSSFEVNSLPQEACKQVRSQVFFPSCWDGENLDSEDHKSHMAYPTSYNGGVCPKSHPIAIFGVFYEFYFHTEPYSDYENLLFAMGDPTGYGFHGDFVNGWTDQEALQKAFATCTGTDGMNAPECTLGTGEAVEKKVEVSEPNEPVGQDGPLAKLPGDNPVTGSLKTAKPRSRIHRGWI